MSQPTDTRVASFQFQAPQQLHVRQPDGKEILMGFGIGERVDVLLPIQNLHDSMSMAPAVFEAEHPRECLLADGSGTLLNLFDASLKSVPPPTAAVARRRSGP